MNLRYTLCFIRKDGRILMLLRKHQPNAWLLNGVGGKIKPNETPQEANRREVFEEAGIVLKSARFGGIVTWGGDREREGMYVFVADLPEGYETWGGGEKTDEGTLYWLMEEDACYNPLVVDNIARFLPPMLKGEEPAEYHCIYHGMTLLDVERLPLERFKEMVK